MLPTPTLQRYIRPSRRLSGQYAQQLRTAHLATTSHRVLPPTALLSWHLDFRPSLTRPSVQLPKSSVPHTGLQCLSQHLFSKLASCCSNLPCTEAYSKADRYVLVPPWSPTEILHMLPCVTLCLQAASLL